jgi:UDP-N-acetylglucosamine:LPS N-acetylglucosamine transferase
MKIILVCSHGGHVTEMEELRDCFAGQECIFFTYRGAPLEGPDKICHFDNISKNPWFLLKTGLRMFWQMFKIRPDALVSTGAELAVPAFYLGKFFFRARLVYLECSAQVYTPSLTGRLVYWITDLFLVQWPTLLPKYGRKAKYVGGLI